MLLPSGYRRRAKVLFFHHRYFLKPGISILTQEGQHSHPSPLLFHIFFLPDVVCSILIKILNGLQQCTFEYTSVPSLLALICVMV